ncbi:MAG: bacteriorhodopsin, partial [Bacteroidota bacterium]
MLNFENFVEYSPMAYHMVSHILTLGYATMLAGLLYFALTLNTVSARFRISSVLSVVVMTSAFLLLYAQQANWTSSFVFNPETETYVRGAAATGALGTPDTFNNGYRYLNWLIDVPMLLLQILFVVEITRERRRSLTLQFMTSGVLMIVTGYIGQFYEVTNIPLFLIWGTISTVFFFHVLWLMYKLLNEQSALPPRAQRVMKGIWWLFLISWMLYPGAYLMPVLLEGEIGVVGR